MEDKAIRHLISDSPALTKYYQDNIEEVNAFINKYAISQGEIEDLMAVMKKIDEEFRVG